MKKELSTKQISADKDLNIIIYATLIPLIVYFVFGNQIMDFVKSNDGNIWLKSIPIMLIQYGLAGFGSSIVMLYRKEKPTDYGVVKKNFIKTILLSVVVCIPAFVFMLVNNEIGSYLPLQGCNLTREFLASGFPTNVLGYGLIVLIWGLWEGFNYVVISRKVNERYPGKNQWLNTGAITCGILCVLIHGMIGVDLYTIFEAITTFVLIYGMLIIKDKTNNAWGCVLISLLFWNAF